METTETNEFQSRLQRRQALKKEHQKNKKSSVAPMIWLGIMLMIGMLGLALKQTLFSAEYISKQIVSPNIVQQISSEVTQTIDDYAKQLGVPAELTENLINQKELKSDIGVVVVNIYNDQSDLLSGTKVQKTISQRIEENAKAQHISLQSEDYLSFKSTLLHQINSTLKQKTQSPEILQMQKIFHLWQKTTQISLIVAGIGIVIFSVQIILREYTWVKRLKMLGFAACWSGLSFYWLVTLVAKLYQEHAITSQNPDVNSLIIDLSQKVFMQMKFNGVLGLILAIVLILISFTLRRFGNETQNKQIPKAAEQIIEEVEKEE